MKANEQLPAEVECCKFPVETVELFSTVAETFPEAGISDTFSAWLLNGFNLWADKDGKTKKIFQDRMNKIGQE